MSLDNGYVTADYLKKVAQMGRAIKQLSYERMGINNGDTLLDVGCGPGVDTVPLAALCNEGKVIGIDSDTQMLAEAEKAAHDAACQTPIEYLNGSALSLPLENNSVDACRAERLLQVLPQAVEREVIAEMVRVTRPGGRIVLVDTDWGSVSVDFSDTALERKLMQFFALQMRPNGLAGRRLHRLLQEQKLDALQLDLMPVVQRRLEDTPFGDWLITTALSQSVINQDEAQLWQEELLARERQQSFFATVNIVIASGALPLHADHN